VLPALIRKFWDAKRNGAPEVTVWGTGKPRREFLYVDDLADACIYLMQNYSDEGLVNIGWGHDVTIRELAQLVQQTVRYPGALRFDESKPDGAPRKLLDVSRMTALGWRARIDLEEGLEKTLRWYYENAERVRQ
jgi:GDP-L-fucose synthase